MITDEATSALDAASEKEVQVALDAVMKGRTSLIIAHRLGTMRPAIMIHALESRELAEPGRHEKRAGSIDIIQGLGEVSRR